MTEGMFFGLLGAAIGLGGAGIGILTRPATAYEPGGTAPALPSPHLGPYGARVNVVVAYFAVKAAGAAILISQTL